MSKQIVLTLPAILPLHEKFLKQIISSEDINYYKLDNLSHDPNVLVYEKGKRPKVEEILCMYVKYRQIHNSSIYFMKASGKGLHEFKWVDYLKIKEKRDSEIEKQSIKQESGNLVRTPSQKLKL